MLQEFEIEIKEVLSRVQKVEAESASEAIDRAMEMYYGQEIILDAEDMKGVDFTPMEIQKGMSR
jgi:tyrosine-protein phosphatase YwqE